MADTPAPVTKESRDGAIDAVLLCALLVVTLVNIAVGEAHPAARGWWIAVILFLAFAKAVAIGYRYMMLARAPRPLLLAFIAWAVVFFTLTTVLATV